MCGIAGFTGEKDKALLRRMTDSIKHRGPDGEGFYFDQGINLGHRRLAIIDLEGSSQPLRKNQVSICYNGEIYNYQALRQDLQSEGINFQSNGDVEVLLEAFRVWGAGVFSKLSGMWAFAYWDEKQKKLYLARDHFGIKPLYYMIVEGNLFFASEIKALLQHHKIKPILNLKALRDYLTYRFVVGEYTAFEGIYVFPKGSWAEWDGKRLSFHQYYSPKFSQNACNKQDFANQLTQAVKSRMVADVEVGCYLSGGLDSSAITYHALAQNRDLHTFTYGFSDSRYDESIYAKKVADYLQIKKHTLLKSESEFDLEKAVWHTEDLLADATILPTLELSQLTAKHLKVVLSGDGADELLGGYSKYKVIVFLEYVRPLLRHFTFIFKLLGYKWQRLADYLTGLNFGDRYLNLTSVFSRKEQQELMGEELDPPLLPKLEGTCLQKLIYLDQQAWLERDILLKTDKLTMAASLESRVPFLSQEFASYANSLADDCKVKGGQEKRILRWHIKEIFGNLLKKRMKQGFSVPVDMLQEQGRKYITEERNEKLGVFNWVSVQKYLNQDLHNIYRRRQYFAILYLFVWHKVFIEDNI